ncbi:hypothetical protein KV564_17585 [Paenibacillus chitinolyticus]|nr:hypothetical protein [Paenibacillus chitinolyticus]
MILQFFGKTSVLQCSLYKTGKGTTSCDNNPGSDKQAQKALYDNGVSDVGRWRVPTALPIGKRLFRNIAVSFENAYNQVMRVYTLNQQWNFTR